ncbi:hypothetical protein HK098_005507 [Nowakowskiella sp. JEL0407]|nr:hypothetical protein HK098_005507 [Nowakowskiella sp. JEL0407]
MNSKFIKSIFISYRQKTCKAQAEKLYLQTLARDSSRKVFWDEMSIPVGVDWKQYFLDNIGKAYVAILLISKATLDTFGNTGVADNVLLEWDRALDLYEDGKLKIFPVLILENGETELDFGSVSLSDVRANDCCRSPKEIWDVIRKLNVFKVDFARTNDLRVLDHEITQLCPVTTAISKRAVISGQIKNPRNCIGRDGVLSAMASGLSDPTRSAAILIYGGPGMGKTTVASRYVHNLKESGSMPYTHVLWISLFSDETFEEDIKHTRELLGIPDDDNFDRLKNAVYRWFAENSCYLVILDNVDAVSIADKHLDEMIISGHAIITSRNPTMDEFIPLGISEERIVRQEINTWSKDVTKAYVYCRLKPRLPKIDSEVDALDKILDFVDGYPLVVEQTCSFLLHARHRSFSEVLEQIQAKDSEIWDHTPSKGASHFRRTLDVTFKMLIDFLVDSGQTSACVLLGAIGCVSNKDIPIHSYLKEYLSQAGFDANMLNDSLNTLFSISLISVDDERSFVSVHLAVQDVVRRKLMHTDFTAAPFPDLATLALNAIFPRLENDTYSLQNLTLGKTLLPLVSQLCKEDALARDRNLADLCYSGSELAEHSCSYKVALTLNSVAIDVYIAVNGGRENVYVGDAIYLQGRIYDDQGDYKNATKQYIECLEIYEKVHGTRVHASVANCMVCLGLIADAQGDYDKAIKLYSESLEIYEKVYGTRVQCWDTINNLLVRLQDAQGRLQQSHPAIFGEFGVETGSINNLGLIANAQDDYNKAIKLYSESLEIYEKIYGTRVQCWDTINNLLVRLQDAQGRLQQSHPAIFGEFGVETMRRSMVLEYSVGIRSIIFWFDCKMLKADYNKAIQLYSESLEWRL